MLPRAPRWEPPELTLTLALARPCSPGSAPGAAPQQPPATVSASALETPVCRASGPAPLPT